MGLLDFKNQCTMSYAYAFKTTQSYKKKTAKTYARTCVHTYMIVQYSRIHELYHKQTCAHAHTYAHTDVIAYKSRNT